MRALWDSIISEEVGSGFKLRVSVAVSIPRVSCSGHSTRCVKYGYG